MYRKKIDWQDLGMKAVLALGGIGVLISSFSTIYLMLHPELLNKLWVVMIHNLNFWIIMVAGVMYGIWRKFSNPGQFSWKELPAQLGVGMIVTVGCFGAFLFWSSGLQDTEVWNSHAVTSEYYEEWTELVTYTEEECTGTGEDRTCYTVTKTRHDYHPPKWRVETSTGEIVAITSGEYRQYVGHYKNEQKENLFHLNQISIGDGDKYFTVWPKTMETLVPVATEHDYVNYLRASRSIRKLSGTAELYKDYLLPYPRVHSGKFGDIEFNRVIDARANVPKEWKSVVEKKLDNSLAFIGAEKQVNVIVYIVGNENREFRYALEEVWVSGKKNDVTVIIGTTAFPKIGFADVMIFSGNEALVVHLSKTLTEKGEISDPNWFAQTVISSIDKDFTRVPMSELQDLLYDVEIPWWAILLSFICIGCVVVAVSVYLENN